MDEFSSTHIDNEEDVENDEEVNKGAETDTHFNSYMANHKVLQLKNSVIPKGLVPLEFFFDNNDVSTKPVVLPKDESIKDCNLGTS